MPDSWVYQGERDDQLAEAGLDSASIASVARKVAVELSRATVTV
jgi:hypothetical protein